MGLIRKFGRKVKKGLGSLREEAKHPGRPPGHKVSQNPYWEKEKAKAAASGEDPAEKKTVDERGDYWFLDGSDVDGWDQTDAVPQDDE